MPTYEKVLNAIKIEGITSMTRLKRKFPTLNANEWAEFIARSTAEKHVETQWISAVHGERFMQVEYIGN